jgi:hypothetical protein
MQESIFSFSSGFSFFKKRIKESDGNFIMIARRRVYRGPFQTRHVFMMNFLLCLDADVQLYNPIRYASLFSLVPF